VPTIGKMLRRGEVRLGDLAGLTVVQCRPTDDPVAPAQAHRVILTQDGRLRCPDHSRKVGLIDVMRESCDLPPEHGCATIVRAWREWLGAGLGKHLGSNASALLATLLVTAQASMHKRNKRRSSNGEEAQRVASETCPFADRVRARTMTAFQAAIGRALPQTYRRNQYGVRVERRAAAVTTASGVKHRRRFQVHITLPWKWIERVGPDALLGGHVVLDVLSRRADGTVERALLLRQGGGDSVLVDAATLTPDGNDRRQYGIVWDKLSYTGRGCFVETQL